jgi:hypothetical protein
MSKQEILNKVKNPTPSIGGLLFPVLSGFLRELVMEFIDREPDRIEVIIKHGDKVPEVEVYDSDLNRIEVKQKRISGDVLQVIIIPK